MSETSPLLSLASQFGYAIGSAAPLRTALMNPDKNAYRNATEEHDRGAVLVAAVIDGFLRSYHDAIADLVRIATAGTGVLQPGALHPDLVTRVASTACMTAERITQICIRAFDYLPPVDVTFSDYSARSGHRRLSICSRTTPCTYGPISSRASAHEASIPLA